MRVYLTCRLPFETTVFDSKSALHPRLHTAPHHCTRQIGKLQCTSPRRCTTRSLGHLPKSRAERSRGGQAFGPGGDEMEECDVTIIHNSMMSTEH